MYLIKGIQGRQETYIRAISAQLLALILLYINPEVSASGRIR